MADPLATRGDVSSTINHGVRLVVQTWKNHLDAGFTGSEAKVVHDAVRWLLPTATSCACLATTACRICVYPRSRLLASCRSQLAVAA